jgi:hypothetical protein
VVVVVDTYMQVVVVLVVIEQEVLWLFQVQLTPLL